MTIAAIPSPGTAVWNIGPLPIRAYALCIILGIVVACVVAEVRLRRRGAAPYAVLDVALWAVPFGIVGARIYHLITSPQGYFVSGRSVWGNIGEMAQIWHGGLGIWGAVAGGALGAWIGCRQLGIPLSVFADALAPGLPLAQAVGRLGNWFNNELFGGATTVPWGLEIHRMDADNPGHAVLTPDGKAELLPGLYHPTFAYEALWNIGVAILVVLLDRRVKFGRGRAFALYVMAYTAGRFWIELMRTDEANVIFGARVNVWVSVLAFLGALVYFLRVRGPQQFLIPVPAETAPAATEPATEAAAEAGEETGAGVKTAAAAGGAAVGAGYHVVSEQEYRAYQRTGLLPAEPVSDPGGDPGAVSGAPVSPAVPVSSVGVLDDETDDGADLVDATMPPLDDFADDVTDDEEEPDEDVDEDIDPPEGGTEQTARPVGSADER